MEKQEVYQWINAYQGGSDFLNSLRNQYLYKGFLSERQIECVIRTIRERSAPREFSLKVGEKLLLGKSVSTRISQSIGVDFVHRGFEVLNVHAETQKAYLVDVKFTATRTVTCCVCGIHLKNEVSRSIGIGPVCAEKHGIPYEVNALNLLQAKLDAVEQVAHKVWVPKYAIKEKEEINQQQKEAV